MNHQYDHHHSVSGFSVHTFNVSNSTKLLNEIWVHGFLCYWTEPDSRRQQLASSSRFRVEEAALVWFEVDQFEVWILVKSKTNNLEKTIGALTEGLVYEAVGCSMCNAHEESASVQEARSTLHWDRRCTSPIGIGPRRLQTASKSAGRQGIGRKDMVSTDLVLFKTSKFPDRLRAVCPWSHVFLLYCT